MFKSQQRSSRKIYYQIHLTNRPILAETRGGDPDGVAVQMERGKNQRVKGNPALSIRGVWLGEKGAQVKNSPEKGELWGDFRG